DTLQFDYHTPPRASLVNGGLNAHYPFGYTVVRSVGSKFYSPTVHFTSGITQVNVLSPGGFADVVVNRPNAPQPMLIRMDTADPFWYSASFYNGVLFPSEANPGNSGSSGVFILNGQVDLVNSFDVEANAGTLDVVTALAYPFVIHGNAGTLSITDGQ